MLQGIRQEEFTSDMSVLGLGYSAHVAYGKCLAAVIFKQKVHVFHEDHVRTSPDFWSQSMNQTDFFMCNTLIYLVSCS